MQIATKTTWCRHSSTGLEPEDIRMNIKITPGASQCPVPSGIHQTWVNDYCDGRFRGRWTFASLGSWYQNRFQCGISIISHRFSAMSYVFLSALLPLALEKERLPWEKFWCCETMLRNPMKNWDIFSLQTKRNRRTKRMRIQTSSLWRVDWNERLRQIQHMKMLVEPLPISTGLTRGAMGGVGLHLSLGRICRGRTLQRAMWLALMVLRTL